MYVTEFWPKEPIIPGPPSPDFALWRREARLIDGIAAYGGGGSVTLTGAGEPERIAGTRVTQNLLPLIGAPLALGRNFTAEEDLAGGGPRAVILGHGLWQRRFGGSAAAIGKAITLDGAPCTVVGVLPPRFRFPDNNFREELLIPMALPAEPSWSDDRNFRLVRVVARVKNGVAPEALRQELAGLLRGASAQEPAQFKRMRENFEVRVTPLREWLTGSVRTMVWRLAGAVAMVLLIACLNIAGLQAALAVTRRKEMALRAATGAGRARLIRQLLTESLLLTAVAGCLGVAIGYAGVGAIRSYLPENLRLGGLIEVDRGVLLFTIAVTATTGLFTGLLPALSAARLDVQTVLKDNGERQAGAGASAQRVQSALLIAEVAAAMMLLLGAGLLIRNFFREANAAPGFDARGVFTLKVSPSPRRYAKREERVAFMERLLERARAIPGVRHTAIGGGLPLIGSLGAAGVSFADRPEPPVGARPTVPAASVSADYFRALGIPVMRGRAFTDAEPSRVAMVNQAFADQFFPGKNPLGQRIEFFSRDGSWREIVGVVGNVKQLDAWGHAQLMMYAPLRDSIEPEVFLLLHSSLPAEAIRAAALNAVRDVDPQEPVFDAATMDGRLRESLAPRRAAMTLMSLFAALAMLLTAIGLFGAIAYAVNQRRREIAIRVALGATPGALLRWVLGRGLRVVLAGVGLGAAGMAAMGRWETAVALPAALVFIAIAALACWIPGRRALAVSPAAVMREG